MFGISKKMLNEFSICPTFHTTLNGPHSAAWQNHPYSSKLSSDEATPDDLLCAPTNCHCTSSIAFITSNFIGHWLVYMPFLFIRLKALWGPKLIYYYLFMGLRTWQILSKCTLNWTRNCWRNSWTHGSTVGIVKFQNKNSYKFCIILPYNLKSSLTKETIHS